ncbi:M64 family metallopeptidase [Dyadobacter sp. CY326]|uniref:M64 family metallopeptidase n=1 Tax=Dyadobacter sp. CY326 TaxID=2907300 RepID=UPI001F47649D|nr:M64 family metallopeptidase [Dyadobacter sp. CY326]MCE7064638.1 M64 family metallo-endopeptidase [Dyadobacter sp. CY326]
MTRFFTLILFFVCFNCFSQNFKVDTIHQSGSIDKRINVVILGDGFTEAELPRFKEQARLFADFFLAYTPYNTYRNYFNFFSIPTPSKESGVSNPGTAPDAYADQPVGKKDTYYGASFGESIHRLVTVTKYQALSNVLAFNFPSYDLVVLLVNTPFYGGSGGSIAVHTLHSAANTIGVHEIGHTFSYLNDEYWAGPQYGWEAANMTAESNPELVKWKNWLNETNIGVFKHGEGEAAKWFKPTEDNCLMEFLDKPFCAVCKETTTERILQVVNPIDKMTPDTTEESVLSEDAKTFKIDLVEPEPNTLQILWSLDGKPIKSSGKEISLSMADLSANAGLLTASVFDSTHLSRHPYARGERTRMAQWKLVRSSAPQIFKLRVSDASICPGEFTMLTTSGCVGNVSWSTGETGASINVSPQQTADFTATCKTTGQPDASLKTRINVFPKPEATASNTGPYFEKATIEISASGGSSYYWTGPDNFLSQIQVSLIENATVKNSGVYEVRVVDLNGCADTARTEVKVEPILGAENPVNTLVRVSPNPAKGFVKVSTAQGGESVFTMFDMNGRKVVEKRFMLQTDINVEGKSAGLYLYKFSNGEKEISGKLLIQ